jgi:hypothetical protein
MLAGHYFAAMAFDAMISSTRNSYQSTEAC